MTRKRSPSSSVARIKLKRRISSTVIRAVHSDPTKRPYPCCRKAVEDGCYRPTKIDGTVYTECGHYVTVKV